MNPHRTRLERHSLRRRRRNPQDDEQLDCFEGDPSRTAVRSPSPAPGRLAPRPDPGRRII